MPFIARLQAFITKGGIARGVVVSPGDHSDMTMLRLVSVGRELSKRSVGLDDGGSRRR